MLDDVIQRKKLAEQVLEKKESHLGKAVFIFLSIMFVLISAGVIAYQYIELERIKKANIKQEQRYDLKIKKLNQEKEYLAKQYRRYKSVIDDYKQENRKLVSKLRRAKNNNYDNQIKPKVYKQQNKYTNRKTYTKQRVYNKPTTYKKQRVKSKPTKKYQKFSKNIKLISDSQISRRSDNRLQSNSYIRGRYYPKAYSYLNGISNVTCGLKNDIYKVDAECSMKLSNNHDKVYLRKSNAKNIRNFNYKTHMIECDYNQEHGMMHNCQIKMYKRR